MASRRKNHVPSGALCSYCGDKAEVMDHIHPWRALLEPDELADSGLVHADDPRNLTPACVPCNANKGGAYIATWLIGEIALPRVVGWVPARTDRYDEVRNRVWHAYRSGRCAPWVTQMIREHLGEVARVASLERAS